MVWREQATLEDQMHVVGDLRRLLRMPWSDGVLNSCTIHSFVHSHTRRLTTHTHTRTDPFTHLPLTHSHIDATCRSCTISLTVSQMNLRVYSFNYDLPHSHKWLLH